MNETNPARICVPVCVSRASDLLQAVKRASELADIIELRLDCLEPSEVDQAMRGLDALLAGHRGSIILTLRPLEQGGKRAIDYARRYAFWSASQHILHENFIDLELDLSIDLMNSASRLGSPINWNHVICSHHDFAGIPADLEKIYERMAATPAKVLKIAVQANDATDCLAVFRLLERACREGHEMIAIAMGEAGVATRILAASRGAFLTYGSLDEANATAPGQISAKDLRELYRVHQLNEQTQITGLVGAPVSHSISPHIHNAGFATQHLNAVYIPFEVRDLNAFMRRMAHPRTREIEWNLRGLSVTAPHKSAIMQYLEWVEPAAQEIGAVNTIVVEDDALYGYNTDASAFLAPLQNKLGELRDARCAVIGAGGAARSVLWSLRKAGAQAFVFARNQACARELAGHFGALCRELTNADFRGFDAVVNVTPLGTRGTLEDETPAVASQLEGVRVAYDLVYNPPDTRFLREARLAGCEIIGGLAMLIHQAAAQYELWTNAPAPLDIMREAAERKLLNVGT